MSFHPFSADLWDYIEDMPYMPSRVDRDALKAGGADQRVQIWDYFFRARPEDVGAPQRGEIQAVRADLEAAFQAHRQAVEQLEFDLRASERALLADRRRHLIIGVPLLLMGMLLAALLVRMEQPINNVLLCWGLFGLPGAFFFGALWTGYAGPVECTQGERRTGRRS